MRLTLKVWRQGTRANSGAFKSYPMDDVNPDMSMLECLDVLNEQLIERGEDPIAFEHDCREGICGSCGFMISGIAHGPLPATTVCQLTMRHFKDGEELVLEPWRARAFPLIKDLVVDRRSFDRIIAAGLGRCRSRCHARIEFVRSATGQAFIPTLQCSGDARRE